MRSLGDVAKTGPAKTGPTGPLATAMEGLVTVHLQQFLPPQ